jgi:hypothetical protein
MRIIISLLLLVLCIFLGFVLVKNIQEPIAFEKVKDARGSAVANKLSTIRSTQEIYRKITGEFAPNFDTLSTVLKVDSIPHVSIEEDPKKPGEYIETVTYTPAIDSINILGIDLDGLKYVPFTDDQKEFAIDADTMTYQQTLVSVVQVGTRWKEFMGKYADVKYSKYDNSYNPDHLMKFGDMNSPNISGNWDQ